MTDPKLANRSCLASNAAWRRMAATLQAHAETAHLTQKQRELLLREADAAERQADWWLAGAIEAT
jgi:hypothetical protein